jgi:hypothetical protein
VLLIDEGLSIEHYCHGKGNLLGEKPVPVALCPYEPST